MSTRLLSPLPPEDWRARAACAQEVAEAHPDDRQFVHEMWQPFGKSSHRTQITPEVHQALTICNGGDGHPPCPVREQCLAEGMRVEWGIWGGRLPEERAHLFRGLRRREAANA